MRPASALARTLGLWQCVGIAVGTIIGTGVFLKAAVMSQLAGSPLWVLAAWAVGGLLSLGGALTYAELGAMFPHAGGEYVYLREGYGRFAGYVYGWTRFWIGSPGSIAAYAVGAATFLSGVIPLERVGGIQVVAISLIAGFALIGCLRVRVGGNLQVVLTALKVVIILALAVAAFAYPGAGSWSHLSTSSGGAFPGASAFGLTVLAALWAYDGWNNLPMAAGEVAEPERQLPRALVLGTLAVLAIYAAINLAYFYALPFAEVASANSTRHPDAPAVAAKVAAAFLGQTSTSLLAVAMAVSALSAMHGSILTGARVPFAVARDGLAPRQLATLSASAVPVTSVLVLCVTASGLVLTGSFDQLTNSVVFASWIFYALNAGSVILLRRRHPTHPRPFRVPGYPVVPAAFALLSTLLLINTAISSPRDSLFGLVLIATSVPVYWLSARRRR